MAPPKGFKFTAEHRAKLRAAQAARWANPESRRVMSSKIRGLVRAVPSGTTLRQRLDYYSMPEPNSGCRLWLGHVDEAGYGLISWQGRVVRAHRASWEEANGPLPDGLIACHHCDVPGCIESTHIFPGTHGDNAADRMRKGRHRCDPLRGEEASWAKLTERDVLEIRRSHSTLAALGARFDVSRSHIHRVRRGLNWSHL